MNLFLSLSFWRNFFDTLVWCFFVGHEIAVFIPFHPLLCTAVVNLCSALNHSYAGTSAMLVVVLVVVLVVLVVVMVVLVDMIDYKYCLSFYTHS